MTHHRTSPSRHSTHAAVANGAHTVVENANEALEALKEKTAHVRERVKDGLHTTESAIKDHPWMAVGVATAAGVGLGLLLGLFARRD